MRNLSTNFEMDLKAEDGFCFESTHLALRNNADYLKLTKHLAVLCSSRIQVHSQIDELRKLMENSLEVFVEKLRKKDLVISVDIEIPQVIIFFKEKHCFFIKKC